MHARDDFADPSLDTGLLPQLSDVFSGLANDNACILCADECTKGQGIVTGGRGRTRLRWRYWRKTRKLGSPGMVKRPDLPESRGREVSEGIVAVERGEDGDEDGDW
jgi:hypothetical protein